jgi:O-antigen ligase/tetratricopeptide (TPR) repeat protein
LPIQSRFDRALRYIALAGIYGALLAIAVAAEVTVYPYVFLKTILLNAIVSVTFPAFLVLAWRQPAWRPRRAWLSMALVAYVVALSLSCALAFHRHRAFWGSQDRMVGLFSLLFFSVWYVMATSLLRSWRDWRRLLHWQLVLGVLVAAFAAIEAIRSHGERVWGALGNPIYTGTYQVFLIGFATLLWVRTRSVALRALYGLTVILSLFVLLRTASRGPLLGLACGVMVVVLAWTLAGRRWWYLFGLVGSAAFAAIGYTALMQFESSWPQRLGVGHLFWKNTYELRPIIWKSAWAAFRARPIVGWGLDSYEAAWGAHFVPSSICAGGSDFWADTAHSLLFEHLSTTGALGTLTFAALWIVLVLGLWRAFRRGWIDVPAGTVLVSLSVAYLVQGQFISNSPSAHMMCFFLLALSAAAGFPEFSVKDAALPKPLVARSVGFRWGTLLTVFATGGVLLAWHTSVLPGLASHASLQSEAAFRHGGCKAMLKEARYAASIPTPWAQDQLEILSQTLRDMAQYHALGACPEWRQLYELTRREAEAVYSGHPERFRFRGIVAALTRILGLESKDPNLIAEAQRIYEILIEESPDRQFFRYQLASLLTQTGRLDAAENQLTSAVAIDPNMGESLWRLGVFRWFEKGQAESGSKLIVKGSVGFCHYIYWNSDEMILLAQAFFLQGDLAGLRSMEQRMKEDLPSEEPRPASAYRKIAGFQAQAGLSAESNRMLQIADARDSGLHSVQSERQGQ